MGILGEHKYSAHNKQVNQINKHLQSVYVLCGFCWEFVWGGYHNRKTRPGLKELADQGFKNSASKTIRKQFISRKSRTPNRVIHCRPFSHVLALRCISYSLPPSLAPKVLLFLSTTPFSLQGQGRLFLTRPPDPFGGDSSCWSLTHDFCSSCATVLPAPGDVKEEKEREPVNWTEMPLPRGDSATVGLVKVLPSKTSSFAGSCSKY